METEHTNIAVIVTIIVIVIFFGGWYIFFGQLYNQETNTGATVQENPQIEQSGLVTPEAETATTAPKLPTE